MGSGPPPSWWDALALRAASIILTILCDNNMQQLEVPGKGNEHHGAQLWHAKQHVKQRVC